MKSHIRDKISSSMSISFNHLPSNVRNHPMINEFRRAGLIEMPIYTILYQDFGKLVNV